MGWNLWPIVTGFAFVGYVMNLSTVEGAVWFVATILSLRFTGDTFRNWYTRN